MAVVLIWRRGRDNTNEEKSIKMGGVAETAELSLLVALAPTLPPPDVALHPPPILTAKALRKGRENPRSSGDDEEDEDEEADEGEVEERG